MSIPMTNSTSPMLITVVKKDALSLRRLYFSSLYFMLNHSAAKVQKRNGAGFVNNGYSLLLVYASRNSLLLHFKQNHN